MKFSERLEANKRPKWSGQYIEYKALNDLIDAIIERGCESEDNEAQEAAPAREERSACAPLLSSEQPSAAREALPAAGSAGASPSRSPARSRAASRPQSPFGRSGSVVSLVEMVMKRRVRAEDFTGCVLAQSDKVEAFYCATLASVREHGRRLARQSCLDFLHLPSLCVCSRHKRSLRERSRRAVPRRCASSSRSTCPSCRPRRRTAAAETSRRRESLRRRAAAGSASRTAASRAACRYPRRRPTKATLARRRACATGRRWRTGASR